MNQRTHLYDIVTLHASVQDEQSLSVVTFCPKGNSVGFLQSFRHDSVLVLGGLERGPESDPIAL
jgi:hypothetical protein